MADGSFPPFVPETPDNAVMRIMEQVVDYVDSLHTRPKDGRTWKLGINDGDEEFIVFFGFEPKAP